MTPEKKAQIDKIMAGLTKKEVNNFRTWLESKGKHGMSYNEVKYMLACVQLKQQNHSNAIYKRRHG